MFKYLLAGGVAVGALGALFFFWIEEAHAPTEQTVITVAQQVTYRCADKKSMSVGFGETVVLQLSRDEIVPLTLVNRGEEFKYENAEKGIVLWTKEDRASIDIQGEKTYKNCVARIVHKDGVKRYYNDDFGISFAFPEAYVMGEKEVGTPERGHFTITLFDRSLIAAQEAGEQPPSIVLDFYQNDLDKLTLIDWLTKTAYSKLKLGSGKYESTEVAGREAVKFSWVEGYNGRTTAFLHGNAIVSVSGNYKNESDAIYADFDRVISSVALKEIE